MAQRTEQESRLEKELEDLTRNFPQYIRIEFIPADESEMLLQERSRKIKGTQAFRQARQVHLVLFETSTESGLNEWADAIIKAGELVGQLESEVSWEKTNPNFFKAMKAKFG